MEHGKRVLSFNKLGEMKTFDDLKFGPHPKGQGLQAKMFFENGYGISVVRFKISDTPGDFLQFYRSYGSYTSNDTDWEVAVLLGNKESWDLHYGTPITDDVIGHLTDEEVTDIMRQIQELPAP